MTTLDVSGPEGRAVSAAIQKTIAADTADAHHYLSGRVGCIGMDSRRVSERKRGQPCGGGCGGEAGAVGGGGAMPWTTSVCRSINPLMRNARPMTTRNPPTPNAVCGF